VWIARELLVESLTLGLFGAVFGIALAYGAVRILNAQDLTIGRALPQPYNRCSIGRRLLV